MNIIGEGINPEISKQIEVRQKVYGSINRSIEQLEYLNSRTAFFKLISSVNLTPDYTPASSELAAIKNKLSGNSLAKDFVLFNGTFDADAKTGRAGISRTGNIINNSAYGLGGLEYGLRPMPGIISADIKNENRGSLKTGTIRIKAYNRVQFEIIDLLYLRLGYGILLEWGNTIYFDNSGKLIKDVVNSLEDDFLTNKYTVESLQDAIQKKRISSNGNYDALFGKIVNFSWEFVEDGSYDITVIVRSIGDVIESIKTNVLVSDRDEDASDEDNTSNQGQTAPPTEPGEGAEETLTIQSYKDKHQIGKLFYDVLTNTSNFRLDTKTGSGYAYFAGLISPDLVGKGYKNFIIQNYQGSKIPQYYIRLGALLAFIQDRVLPKYSNNNSSIPILKFDYQDNNYVYTVPNQISMDPRVCLIKNTIPSTSGNVYTYAEGGEDYVTTISNTKLGKVMNIYVNFMYILTTLDANLDDKDSASLISFLTALLSGIKSAIGGVNDLVPFVEEETNTVKIIDQTPLSNKDNILGELTLVKPDTTTALNLYGYYYTRDQQTNQIVSSSAGFVRNFGIKTELTPELATMLTIGAQAAGSVVGADATALSRLNRGIEDRIKKSVTDANVPISGAETKAEKLVELSERFPKANKNFAEAAFELGSKNSATIPIWDPEKIDSYASLQNEFISYTESKNAIETGQGSGTIGFIPVSLNLTMDGLSGLKIYNALKVDTTYLPSNYPTTMDFIITGVNHKIEDNVWTTNLTTIMVPKNTSQNSGSPMTDGNVGAGGSNPGNQDNNRASARTKNKSAIPESKRRIVEKIIDFARQQGITDRDRLIALITVAQAESGITPGRSESFLYSLDRAKAVFPKKLKGLTDEQILKVIPVSKGGKGTEKTLADKLYSNLYGNGPGEGYKYAGKGMTQITFKGNYEKANENFKKYKLSYDLIKNPEILKTNEDADIALLVIGKLEGQFGNRLRAGVKYSENAAAIIATQDGGKEVPSSAPLKVYSRALQAVLNTQWIQDLIG